MKESSGRGGSTASGRVEGDETDDKDLVRYEAAKNFYSGKASDVVRSAAFAGVALVWAFRGPASSPLPSPLPLAAGLFAATVALDVLQYLTGTAVWTTYFRYREVKAAQGRPEPPGHNPALTWPINLFFVCKVATLAWGYGMVFQYLRGAWAH